jgi:hypothetical protein
MSTILWTQAIRIGALRLSRKAYGFRRRRHVSVRPLTVEGPAFDDCI